MTKGNRWDRGQTMMYKPQRTVRLIIPYEGSAFVMLWELTLGSLVKQMLGRQSLSQRLDSRKIMPGREKETKRKSETRARDSGFMRDWGK